MPKCFPTKCKCLFRQNDSGMLFVFIKSASDLKNLSRGKLLLKLTDRHWKILQIIIVPWNLECIACQRVPNKLSWPLTAFKRNFPTADFHGAICLQLKTSVRKYKKFARGLFILPETTTGSTQATTAFSVVVLKRTTSKNIRRMKINFASEEAKSANRES